MSKTVKLDDDQRIGITETSDICFNLDAFDNLCKANIIVTKRLTTKLIDKLVEHKDKCILHISITGLGGSKVEPLVPTKEESFKKFNELIEKGFPVSHVVLRIDPIIPTRKGINTAIMVMDLFKDSGITRIRYSSLDMYNHVKDRFKSENIPLPYETFHASENDRKYLNEKLRAIAVFMGATIEACGEPDVKTTGFISIKDLEILGLENEIILKGSAEQRGNCSCPQNKKQLINCKPARCLNGCIYCFWKD